MAAALLSSPQDIRLVSFIREGGSLGGDDLQIVVNATRVMIRGNLKPILRGRGRLMLLLSFSFEDTCGRKVVFHLLERCQRCLAISRRGRAVIRPSRLRRGFTPARVKQRFGKLRPHRPKNSRPVEKFATCVLSCPAVAPRVKVG